MHWKASGRSQATLADAEIALVRADEPFFVGQWMVTPPLNQLSAGDRTVRIEPKAMVVLCYLAHRPGHVASREALLSAAWPGVVVGDDALTQVIVKLRKALGDSPENPTYIQTIPKGGYRLLAAVRLANGPVIREPASSASRKSIAAALAAAASLLAAVSAAIWWLVATPASEEPAPSASFRPAPGARPTVAVAPFEAAGGDAQELLLARGITADLVTDLSRMPGLWVTGFVPSAAPTSGRNSTDPASADYVVSGTVQRFGERVRVNVNLASPRTGEQLWSERFDRSLSSMFDLQDELGVKILGLLPVKVSEAEKRRVARRYTRNLEAYEAFQHGQLALHVRRRVENEAARAMFRRAIDLDPSFARAYVALAMTHAADYRNRWSAEGAASLERALDFARTAHQIDPDIPETYWVLAFVHSHRREHDRALHYLETALRLHPSFADGYALMGGIYTSIGRPADAVPVLRVAMRLRPDSGYTYFMLLGRAYFSLGDLEQAQLNLKHAIARNPEFVDARVYMAATYLALEDKDQAAWEADEIRALQPGFTAAAWLETNPTADEQLRRKLLRSLSALGL